MIDKAAKFLASIHRRRRMLRRRCDHVATLIIVGQSQVLCPICGASWKAEPIPGLRIMDVVHYHDVEQYYVDDAEVTEVHYHDVEQYYIARRVDNTGVGGVEVIEKAT